MWKSTTGGSALTNDANYAIVNGALASNVQQSTLTVTAPAADATFYCDVTSTEWSKTNDQTSVDLNVLGMFYCFCNKVQ